MSVLWCGGEDIDFPNGTAPGVVTTAGFFRAGYARCAILANAAGAMKSTVFPGGAITSAWLSCRFVSNNGAITAKGIGFGKSGTNSGLFISGTSSVLTLVKFDGTTATTLATDSSGSLGLVGSINRFDIQLINYGASGTVNIYVNGTLVISFSGNLAVTGVTSLDSVFIFDPTSFQWVWSEIIVADEDTRGWPGLVTMAPNGNGTTQNWSNSAFTNFNPTSITDANATFVNTTAQDEQATLIDLPAGTFTIKAVRIAARALATSGATSTAVKLGVNNGGTVAVGSAHTATTAFATYEDLFATDPTTGNAWLQADMNGLQLELRSA